MAMPGMAERGTRNARNGDVWRRRGAWPLLAALCAVLLLGCTGEKKAQPAPTPTPNVGSTVTAAAPPAGPPGGSGSPTTAVGAAAGPALATATPAATATPPLSASRVETVKLVADLLLDRYYKPLKSNDVLNNAWKGAAQAAGRAGGQVAGPKLSGDRTADWGAFRTQYEQLYTQAAGNVQGTALAFGAAEQMAAGLHDDHTYFLNPEDNKRRQASDNGGERIIGIGVTISSRAPFSIETVVPGGPADKGGVRPGDQITAIDGADVSGLRQQDLAERLRGGAAGTPVRLTLKRASGGAEEVTLTRAEIVQPAIETKLMPDGVGYIALHNFADAYARFSDGRNIAETLDAALQGFEQAGVKGWIFDVRGNPGGSEQTLAEVAGRFLPDGLVLVSTDRAGQTTEAPVDGHLFAVQRPLALLIDGQSGSASELFAATLKEYGRARLFGQRTAGAVNGALESELPDGAAVQYTVVEGRTGKERKLLDGVGVPPDENVSGGGAQANVLAGRTDPQYDQAKAWLLEQARKAPLLALATPAPTGALSPAELRAKLRPFGAMLDDLPPGLARNRFGDLVLNSPSELAIGLASDAPNAAQFIQKVRARRWQGGYDQFFGSGEPSPYAVTVDLYADEAGARDAVGSNDFPTGLKPIDPGVKLGDDTTGYQGVGAAEGSWQVVWQRGRLVFTVQFSADPGQSGLPNAVALAQRLDARAATLPRP